MTKEEFLNLVWRLEELLLPLDHLRNEVGKCGGKCNGFDGIDDEGLCPTCDDAFIDVLAEDERLDMNEEFNQLLKKVKQACEEDKTGEYQRILDETREGKIFH